MEWLWLIKSISIFGSDDISMGILFCFPRSLIEQLRVSLESTCDGAMSLGLSKGIIEFTFGNSQLLKGIWFSSIVWVYVSLSESSTPLFIKSRMWTKESFLSISSEESRSCLIKTSLINHETNTQIYK